MVPARISMDVIEQLLVVQVLLVPLDCVIVAEIVPEWHQDDVVGEQRRSFAVLLQQQICLVSHVLVVNRHGLHRVVGVLA